MRAENGPANGLPSIMRLWIGFCAALTLAPSALALSGCGMAPVAPAAGVAHDKGFLRYPWLALALFACGGDASVNAWLSQEADTPAERYLEAAGVAFSPRLATRGPDRVRGVGRCAHCVDRSHVASPAVTHAVSRVRGSGDRGDGGAPSALSGTYKTRGLARSESLK